MYKIYLEMCYDLNTLWWETSLVWDIQDCMNIQCTNIQCMGYTRILWIHSCVKIVCFVQFSLCLPSPFATFNSHFHPPARDLKEPKVCYFCKSFSCSCCAVAIRISLFLPPRSVQAVCGGVPVHHQLLREPGGARPGAAAAQHRAQNQRWHPPGDGDLPQGQLDLG